MEEYIKNPLKLNFNPLEESTKTEIKKIFQDKTARTFWRGIKNKHLVSEDFNAHCLKASKIIKEFGVPDSPDKLSEFVLNHFGCGYSDPKFIEELFPYISGKKNLEYEIVN